jgi:hypothetical protein
VQQAYGGIKAYITIQGQKYLLLRIVCSDFLKFFHSYLLLLAISIRTMQLSYHDTFFVGALETEHQTNLYNIIRVGLFLSVLVYLLKNVSTTSTRTPGSICMEPPMLPYWIPGTYMHHFPAGSTSLSSCFGSTSNYANEIKLLVSIPSIHIKDILM